MELTVNVHEEDGMFWAQVEELPGCFASGKDEAELLEAIKESVALYLAEPASGSPPSGATHVASFRLAVDGGRLPQLA